MKKKRLLALFLSLVFILAITTPVIAAPVTATVSGVKTTKAEYDSLVVTELGCGITVSMSQNNNPVVTIEAGAEPGILTLITKDQDGNNAYLKFAADTLDYQEGAKLTLKVQTSLKAIVYSFEHTQHVAGDMAIFEPTCVEDGYWEIRCKFCGELLDSGVIPAPGHDFSGVNEALVYNEALGKWVYACQRCGCDEIDNFADLSGVPQGPQYGYMAPWDVPGLATAKYAQTAFINHLSDVPIRSGDDTRQSRLYYPVGDDVPEELPMIVFFHGYELSGFNASRVDYIGQGLARCGFLVVVAGHQAGSGGGYFNGYMYNAAAIINGTVAYLDGPNNAAGINLARDDEGRIQYGLMGYSMGCIVAMNMASNYEGWVYNQYTVSFILNNVRTEVPAIPKPLFVFCLEISNGGGTANNVQTGWPMSTSTYGGYWVNLEPDIYVVMTTGSGLSNADKDHALAFWNAIKNHPKDHKQFIGWNSDFKPGGTNITQPARLDAVHYWPGAWPATSATGNGPTLGDNLNALHQAVFRVANAMANTAFCGTDYESWYDYSFMGIWWDGTPINPATMSHEAGMPRDDYWG